MPTTKKSASTAGAKKATPSQTFDAIKLLTDDHKEVSKLFKEYEQLVKADADDEEKHVLAIRICALLTLHAEIEEEIFYPAAREAIEAQDLLDEAEVEHASAKDLIAQIEGMHPSDKLFDAKVTVLGEYIEHHVQEEEGEMFPKVKKSELDLVAIGQELAARKQEFMAQLDAPEPADA